MEPSRVSFDFPVSCQLSSSAVTWGWRNLDLVWKKTTTIVTWFFVMLYMMNSFVENKGSFPGNQFPNFHWRWAEKSGNGVQLIKEIESCSDFSVVSWYQCMKLDDEKKSPKLRLGIAAWTHWSTLVVPFHFAAWFPVNKFARELIVSTVVK